MFTALYDSCVLYSASLRDLFVRLAQTRLYRAHWTEEIHGEWMRNVLKNRPDLTQESLEGCRLAMNAAVTDSVVTGYEGLISALTLPDENDRHVLAAAIHCGADVIVTFNHKDFPPEALAPFRIDVQSPDVFLYHLLDLHASVVYETLKAQREDLVRTKPGPTAFLDNLERQGLARSVFHLRDVINLI